MTRNFQLSQSSFRKITRKKNKRRKKISDEKFSAAQSRSVAPHKNKRRKKKKPNSDEKVLQLFNLGNQTPACQQFLVTFYNYPAREVSKEEKKKKNEKTK